MSNDVEYVKHIKHETEGDISRYNVDTPVKRQVTEGSDYDLFNYRFVLINPSKINIININDFDLVRAEKNHKNPYKGLKYLYYITKGVSFASIDSTQQNSQELKNAFLPECLIDCDYDYSSFFKICNFETNDEPIDYMYCDINIVCFKFKSNIYNKINQDHEYLSNPLPTHTIQLVTKGSTFANGFDITLFPPYNKFTLLKKRQLKIYIGPFNPKHLQYIKSDYNIDNIKSPYRWKLRSRYAVQGLELSINNSCGIPFHICFDLTNKSDTDIEINGAFIQYIPHVTTQSYMLKLPTTPRVIEYSTPESISAPLCNHKESFNFEQELLKNEATPVRQAILESTNKLFKGFIAAAMDDESNDKLVIITKPRDKKPF